MAAKTDKRTIELINEVKRRKQEIAKIEKPNWKTNLSFCFVEGKKNDAIALHTVANVKTLISMAAFLMERRDNYEKAAKLLGVEQPPEFTWDGFSVEDWLEDFKMKISKIQIVSKRKKLEELEQRLGKIISPELRAEMELEAISEELS